LRSGYELTGRNELAIVVAQSHRELVEALALPRPHRHDGLEEQLEAILLGGTGHACNPLHLPMAMRDAPLLLIDMDAIASLVLRSVAGDVGSAHDARDTLGVGLDLDDAHARTDGQRVCAPHEAVIADGLADAVRDPRRLLESAPLEQHSELVATEARDGVG